MDKIEQYKQQIDAIDLLLNALETNDKSKLASIGDIFYYRFFENHVVKGEVIELVPNNNIAPVTRTLSVIWKNNNTFSNGVVRSFDDAISIKDVRSNLEYLKTLIEYEVNKHQETLVEIDKECFLHDLISICKIMKGNNFYITSCQENKRNDYVRDMLEFKGYYTKDQSRHGLSETGKDSGQVDIIICKTKVQQETIVEGLNLTSCDTNKIKTHFLKLFSYDTTGNNYNVLLSYVNVSNFPNLVLAYKRLLEKNDFEPKCLSVKNNSLDESNTISEIITEHSVNGKITYVYHILVYFGNK